MTSQTGIIFIDLPGSAEGLLDVAVELIFEGFVVQKRFISYQK